MQNTMNNVRVCIFSDTHRHHEDVTIPKCDILICCGDFSYKGQEPSVRLFAKWLEATPSKYRVIVTGNHERQFRKMYPQSKYWILEECSNSYVLEDQMVNICGINIYGSFYHIRQYAGSFIERISKKIEGADIVVTHEPSNNILDDWVYVDRIDHIGDENMREAVLDNNVKIHCFGHAHSSYGVVKVNDTFFVNAAVCSEDKKKVCNSPIVFDYWDKKFELVTDIEVVSFERMKRIYEEEPVLID
ncbi:Calcineurin-like phosphoesterase domain-containing protein [Entamoeba marina]